ncbi:hypothetical protein [Pseudarthrobacter sulfonivorans]|uniref:hypothetical protein n=1 Tax=Pseudarthrobacter sulfonivorans TaxID=121292 RepID=UPI002865409D|nr:hypothetical protein [Pseudarthrobacter sulfonivorans]MDR6413324.1 hypothetical protein [Pseudarthrobacter sulfonivorans]
MKHKSTLRRGETLGVWVFGAVVGAVFTCVVRLLTGPGVSGPWLQLAAASVAAAAFLVALRTFNFNVNKSKTDLFNSMHTKLLDADIQLGRALLSDIRKSEEIADLGTDEFRRINRALAHYDTLAMYAIKGDVVREHVVETWGAAMQNLAPQTNWFISYRAHVDGYQSWPHLSQFLAELHDLQPGARDMLVAAKKADAAAIP